MSDTISVPLCPNCLHDLAMGRKYLFAPSLLWCPSCVVLFDADFDHDLGRWVVRP